MTENICDLGKLHYFPRFKVVQSNARIIISQKKYVWRVLDKFWMKNCNSTSTPTESGLILNKNQDGK